MPLITIGGTPIQFPDSGSSPNWSPAVIQFAEAVENVLTGVFGPFDVAPQSFALDLFNPATGVNIPHLTFTVQAVQAVFIKYTVNRTTDVTTAYEVGEIKMVYNPNGPSGSKWEVGRQYNGNGLVTFTVLDIGQVQINTQLLTGSNHRGTIVYSASALLINE